MNKTFKEMSVEFTPDEQSSLILRPADGSFHLPSNPLSYEVSAVLSRWFLATFCGEVDLSNSALFEFMAKPSCVCGIQKTH
jgi:hypothetical protein